MKRPLNVIARLLVLLLSQHVSADNYSEEQIKATYLYKLAQFIEWPNAEINASTDMRVCLLGSGSVVDEAVKLDGYTAGKQILHTIRLDNDQPNTSGCWILYIAKSERLHFSPILKAVRNQPVLTVSDMDDFAEKGGGIGLLIQNNKVKFEVNLDSIEQAGLRLPGQLLNLAIHTYPK